MHCKEFRDANAVWAGDRICKLAPSDVAVAVAIDGGLFTPIIRDAHKKSIAEISKEMKDLASRARSRSLMPQEYTGGSFSISNLGMYGIENFDAIINPPHGSILAVGAAIEKPVFNTEGGIEKATVLSRDTFRGPPKPLTAHWELDSSRPSRAMSNRRYPY